MMRLSAVAGVLCALGVFLSGFNSLTRIREFTPDSMSYVDVARNFAAGHGLSQSALGFGRATFTPADPIPSPFTAHAPGFALLIALAGRASLPYEDAALLLAVLFLGLSLAAAFLLARECYDEAVGWLVVGVLLNYYPLRHASAAAWSETTAICMALCALWLLARYWRRPPAPLAAFLVGLFSGLSFAIRYPMCALALVTGIGVASRMSERRVRDVGAFAAGVLCSAGPVVARNLVLTQTVTGAASNPHATPLLKNLTTTLSSLSEIYQPYYLQTPPFRLEWWLLLASLAVVATVLLSQGRLAGAVRDVLVDRRGAIWIVIWSIAYLAFINIVRSISFFDDLTHRLVVPAGVTLAILWTALVASALGNRRVPLMTIAVVLLAAAVAREAWFAAAHRPISRAVPWTPRLTWVATNTTERDLIIGDYTMDLPFYVGRRAITFEHYPYTNRLTPDTVRGYLDRHCREYEHVYLVVRDWYGTNVTAWVDAFGWLISDLMIGGDSPRYPDYRLVRRLDDSAVFAVTTPACGR